MNARERSMESLKNRERNSLTCHFIAYEEHSKDRQLNEGTYGAIYSDITIRVKDEPKPDPVKPRPPAARRFYFTKLAIPLVYIFVSSHVLANVGNVAPVAGYHRDLPRRFVFSSPAAPTSSPHQHCQLPRGTTGFTSTATSPIYPSDWLLLPRPTSLAPMMTAK